MTDRELLELAAKAAGLGWRWFGATFCVDKDRELATYQPWNPLTDDGDALRLASTLRITIAQPDDPTDADEVGAWTGKAYMWEKRGKDPAAATRRAIVRAAARVARQ